MEYWKVANKQPNLRIALRKIGLCDKESDFNKICSVASSEFINIKHIYIIKSDDYYFCSNKKMGKHIKNYIKITSEEIENDFLIELNHKSHDFFDNC